MITCKGFAGSRISKIIFKLTKKEHFDSVLNLRQITHFKQQMSQEIWFFTSSPKAEISRNALSLRDWNPVQQTEPSPPQTLNPIQLLGPRHIQSEDYSSKVQSYLILWEWDGYDRSDLLKIKLFTLDVKR